MLLMAIGSFRFTNNSSLLKLHLILLSSVTWKRYGALRFKVEETVRCLKIQSRR
jgi:hypothetical protein